MVSRSTAKVECSSLVDFLRDVTGPDDGRLRRRRHGVAAGGDRLRIRFERRHIPISSLRVASTAAIVSRRSSWPTGAQFLARTPHGHFSDYGTWLGELIPRLTTESVVIVGHSTGAAAALASAPSPQVAGLVLVNPFGFVSMHQSPAFRALRLKWAIFPSMENSERLLSQLLSPGFVPDTPLVSWCCLLGEHCVELRYDRRLPAAVINRWADAGTPVAVATGSHDRFVTADRLREPVRSLLDAETIPGCGHLAVSEAPSAVAAMAESIPSPNR